MKLLGAIRSEIPLCIIIGLSFLIPFFSIPTVISPENNLPRVLIMLISVGFLSFFYYKKAIQTSAFRTHTIITASYFLVLVLFLSTIFSKNIFISTFGFAYETASFVIFVLSFLLFLLSSQLIWKKDTVFSLFISLLASFLTFVLVESFRLLHSGLETILSNGFVIGSMSDTAVYCGLIVLLSLCLMRLFPLNPLPLFILTGISIVALLLFIATTSLFISVTLLLFTTLLFICWWYIRSATSIFPSIFHICIILALLVTFFFSSAFQQKIFGTIENRIYPSLPLTFDIAENTLTESPLRTLLGSGPNTFLYQWHLYKPASINNNPLLKKDFEVGFNPLSTFFVTTGLLGIFSFGVFLILFIYYGISEILKRYSSTLFTPFLIATYLWICFLFYSSGVVILTLACIVSGVVTSLLMRQGASDEELPTKCGPLFLIYSRIGIFLLLTICILGGVFFFRDGYAFVLLERGLNAETTLGRSVALHSIERAAQLSPRDIFKREVARLYRDEVAEHHERSFKKNVELGLSAALSSTDTNSLDYRNWLMLGRIYALITQVIGETKENKEATEAAYKAVLMRNPNDSEILLERAYVARLYRNTTEARYFAQEAVSLQKDYEEAKGLLRTLNR